MNKLLALPATVLSCLAILLATDPGRLAFKSIAVGGHQLRMHISGQGNPAVVFEGGGSGGAGAPLEAWVLVQPAVSKFARTVSYDRAGIGWSAPGPKPRDARQVARELHTALLNAHVAPPYILVGHSFGGPLNRVFAGMYPDEVVGMVLVDPTQEEFMDWNQAQSPKHEIRKDEEWKEIQASLTQAHESRVPPGIPIVLITGMGPREFPRFVMEEQKKEYRAMKQVWLKYHQEWVNKLPSAQHTITEKSGHGVPFEEPELIIQEIRKVVEQARRRQ
jgi:pimeloyl-ACP methyl ester carboxylesterase